MFGYHAGIEKSFTSSLVFHNEKYGCKALQICVKSPQSWRNSKLNSTSEKTKATFQKDAELCKQYVQANNIRLFSHGSYLINMSSPKEQALGSAIDDIQAIVALGGLGSVFHVGKRLKMTLEDALNNMEVFIRSVLEATTEGWFILETAAGQGTETCVTLEELGEFYARFEDKSRLKLCVDTCHIFAAGYDLCTEGAVMEYIEKFDALLGWENVALVHFNDSMDICGAKKDRHENICQGKIGEEGMRTFAKQMAKLNIPLILETPAGLFDKTVELAYLKEWCDL